MLYPQIQSNTTMIHNKSNSGACALINRQYR